MKKTDLSHLAKRLSADVTVSIGDLGNVLTFRKADIVKLFRPRFKKRLGSTLLDGDLGFFLPNIPERLDGSRKIEKPATLSLCPIMNLPSLVRQSTVIDGEVSDQFIVEIYKYIDALPDNEGEVLAIMGGDFFERNILERVPLLASYLRRVT